MFSYRKEKTQGSLHPLFSNSSTEWKGRMFASKAAGQNKAGLLKKKADNRCSRESKWEVKEPHRNKGLRHHRSGFLHTCHPGNRIQKMMERQHQRCLMCHLRLFPLSSAKLLFTQVTANACYVQRCLGRTLLGMWRKDNEENGGQRWNVRGLDGYFGRIQNQRWPWEMKPQDFTHMGLNFPWGMCA